MSPYRRKDSKVYTLTLALRNGSYVRRTSESRDRETANGMQSMLNALSRRGSRDWDIVAAIEEKRVSVPVVYDHWLVNDLDALREVLRDEDLASEINVWEEGLAGALAAETVRKYVQQVEWLFPRERTRDKAGRVQLGKRKPVMRSTITRGWLKKKLTAVGGSRTKRARYAAAWMSVLDHLVEAERLEHNPLREITIPTQDASRTPHLRGLDTILRFVNAHPAGVHRALAAFRHGAGIEMQAALATYRRDIVDVENRIIWAHGRKNSHRDRQVVVEPWAWQILWAYVQSARLHPDAPLFPVTKKSHDIQHKAAIDTLRAAGIQVPERYTLHAARHSYGVWMFGEGRDPVLVANNFGHADTRLSLQLYGKFRPTVTEIIRADRRGRHSTGEGK